MPSSQPRLRNERAGSDEGCADHRARAERRTEGYVRSELTGRSAQAQSGKESVSSASLMRSGPRLDRTGALGAGWRCGQALAVHGEQPGQLGRRQSWCSSVLVAEHRFDFGLPADDAAASPPDTFLPIDCVARVGVLIDTLGDQDLAASPWARPPDRGGIGQDKGHVGKRSKFAGTRY